MTLESLLDLSRTLLPGAATTTYPDAHHILSDLVRILRLPLADIVRNWNDGDFRSLGQDRLKQLIMALFADSAYRSDQIDALKDI